jgi:Nuclease-related domain
MHGQRGSAAPAAGRWALEQFRSRRRRKLREEWRDVSKLLAIVAASTAAAVLTTGLLQLVAVGVLGFSIAICMVLWSVGDVRALPYVWGALGERQTAGVLAQLGNHWLCLHDTARARGNWDHICVGPAGVFAIESKSVGGPAIVTNDSLRCGRLVYRGAEFRHAAVELKEEIGREGIPSPHVQAVVVIWGSFPQRFHVEEQVTYIAGDDLLPWLCRRPVRFSRRQVTRLETAVHAVARHGRPRAVPAAAIEATA